MIFSSCMKMLQCPTAGDVAIAPSSYAGSNAQLQEVYATYDTNIGNTVSLELREQPFFDHLVRAGEQRRRKSET